MCAWGKQFFDPKFQANRERRELERLLGEWYGGRRAESAITAHSEKPRSIGAIASRLLAEKLTPEAQIGLKLYEAWDELVGPSLGRYTRFSTFDAGCVTVEVSHPAFLRELTAPDVRQGLLERLRRFAGVEIEQIRFVPAGR